MKNDHIILHLWKLLSSIDQFLLYFLIKRYVYIYIYENIMVRMSLISFCIASVTKI